LIFSYDSDNKQKQYKEPSRNKELKVNDR